MMWIGVIQLIDSSVTFFREIEEANIALSSILPPTSPIPGSEKEKKLMLENEHVVHTDGERTSSTEMNEFEITRYNIKMEISPAAYHFSRLFSTLHSTSASVPASLAATQSLSNTQTLAPLSPLSSMALIPSPPHTLRFTVVLGGNVRTDKFRALDHLIDTVRTHARTPIQVVLRFIPHLYNYSHIFISNNIYFHTDLHMFTREFISIF